jgi:hypothetical protein
MKTLNEICRSYQICTPQTAQKLIKVCQEKGIELPEFTEFVMPFNFGKDNEIVWASKPFYPQAEGNPLLIYHDVWNVFTLAELSELAEKLGYSIVDFSFENLPNSTYLEYTRADDCFTDAPLSNWYAEVLARFIIESV